MINKLTVSYADQHRKEQQRLNLQKKTRLINLIMEDTLR